MFFTRYIFIEWHKWFYGIISIPHFLFDGFDVYQTWQRDIIQLYDFRNIRNRDVSLIYSFYSHSSIYFQYHPKSHPVMVVLNIYYDVVAV